MRNPYWRSRLDRTPFITYTLLSLTVLVFIFEVFNGGSENTETLARFGARWNFAIVAGNQWWRLVTPIFIHIGFVHILVNGLSLYFLGELTEQVAGHWRFLVIYLVSGIAGNVASFAFNGTALSAGASTAIFGLMGAFLFYGDTFRFNPVIATLSRNFIALALINLVFNLFGGTVDLAGHVGGFVGGVLIAGALGAPKLGSYSNGKKVLLGGLLVVALVGVTLLGYNQTVALIMGQS